jgi:hypothetical protein
VTRAWRTLAVVVAGLALASCTFVPTDSHPQVVNSRTVPFNLLVKAHGAPAL